MKDRKRDSLEIVRNHFVSGGYVIEEAHAGLILKVPTERGQLIRCIDPRADKATETHQLGPAIPGGVLGLAFLMEDSIRAHGILAKLDHAMARVQESGFVPSTHGDLDNGEVKGCKFLKALTQKVFPGNHLSEEQIIDAIRLNGIEHQLLVGNANPIGFAVNFEPNTTIIQRRDKFQRIPGIWMSWV